MAKQNDPNKSGSAYRGLPIEGIITAPLAASSKANAQMAVEQTKFIMEFCFTRMDNESGEHYKPVMINLEYKRSFVTPKGKDDTSTNQIVTTTIQVPLLTLVPINSLAINSVKVDFDMEITHQRAAAKSFSDDPLHKRDTPEVHLFGQIGAKRAAPSNKKTKKGEVDASDPNFTTNLSVEITAGPSPLPLGLTAIINAYHKAITPTNEKVKSSKDDASF